MGGRREAALIVDVDEQFRRALSKCLTSEFCFRDLVEAASVEAALELLGECGPFRIAVFDLFTLGEDSADNLRSLRACFPDMPIAIVSPPRPDATFWLRLRQACTATYPKPAECA